LARSRLSLTLDLPGGPAWEACLGGLPWGPNWAAPLAAPTQRGAWPDRARPKLEFLGKQREIWCGGHADRAY